MDLFAPPSKQELEKRKQEICEHQSKGYVGENNTWHTHCFKCGLHKVFNVPEIYLTVRNG